MVIQCLVATTCNVFVLECAGAVAGRGPYGCSGVGPVSAGAVWAPAGPDSLQACQFDRNLGAAASARAVWVCS